MPALYFFLIDVSMNAVQTGATAAACSAISQVITDLPVSSNCRQLINHLFMIIFVKLNVFQFFFCLIGLKLIPFILVLHYHKTKPLRFFPHSAPASKTK